MNNQGTGLAQHLCKKGTEKAMFEQRMGEVNAVSGRSKCTLNKDLCGTSASDETGKECVKQVWATLHNFVSADDGVGMLELSMILAKFLAMFLLKLFLEWKVHHA